MVFSEVPFLFRYLPIVLLIYFISPRKLRNAILFITSLVFYSWGEQKYVYLMLFSTVVDYVHGMLVYKYKQKGESKKAKMCVILSVIINLSLLGFFKYTDFFIGSVNNVFGLSIEFLNVALPIGISFYTFQTMSYTLDIYMKDEEPQRNIIDFGAYVAMFPQLIAGPIVQYNTVAKELRERKETIDDFAIGIKYFVCGLGKKVLLANNIGFVWTSIKGIQGPDMSVVLAWLGIICFALQIYYDFSGYSDMAIGIGKMLGFNFPINFNYPYMSKSVTEFFRRWHMTLGKWFRDYVYIPLGGNRHGIYKQIRNILIVWFLTGFWHGAAYNFVLWGIYFGVLLIIEKTFLLDLLKKLPAVISHIYTLFVVLIGWVLFEFETVTGIAQYLRYMFGIDCSFINDYSVYMVINNIVILLICSIGAISVPRDFATKLSKRIEKNTVLTILFENISMVVVLLICIIYIVAGNYNPFLYFRF